MSVHDIHEIDSETGEQITTRRVAVEDATGRKFKYDFRPRLVDGGHEYLGDGDPSDAALDELDEWLRDNGHGPLTLVDTEEGTDD